MPRLPRFTLPEHVASLVSRLPSYPPAFLLTRALDFGVGRIVERSQIEPLVGRRFALVVRDAGLKVVFEATASGFRPSSAAHEPPDLTISATLRDFIALGLREEDPDTLFFARRLSIEGDTELGLTIKNLLDGIDWSKLPAMLVPFARGASAR
jgi:predicted lipid carrier protein YhbT